jgi:hypothetical protein
MCGKCGGKCVSMQTWFMVNGSVSVEVQVAVFNPQVPHTPARLPPAALALPVLPSPALVASDHRQGP